MHTAAFYALLAKATRKAGCWEGNAGKRRPSEETMDLVSCSECISTDVHPNLQMTAAPRQIPNRSTSERESDWVLKEEKASRARQQSSFQSSSFSRSFCHVQTNKVINNFILGATGSILKIHITDQWALMERGWEGKEAAWVFCLPLSLQGSPHHTLSPWCLPQAGHIYKQHQQGGNQQTGLVHGLR
jgi:hypothetical protein